MKNMEFKAVRGVGMTAFTMLVSWLLGDLLREFCLSIGQNPVNGITLAMSLVTGCTLGYFLWRRV